MYMRIFTDIWVLLCVLCELVMWLQLFNKKLWGGGSYLKLIWNEYFDPLYSEYKTPKSIKQRTPRMFYMHAINKRGRG